MIGAPGRMTATPHIPSRAADPYTIVPRLLDLVRLNGAIFFRSDFRAPWAYWSPRTEELEGALPPGVGSLVMFHIVVSGRCWVALEDGVRHPVRAGEVVVMPYGDANSWGSDEPAQAVPIDQLMPPQPWTALPHLEHGGDGSTTQVVCGYLRGDAVLFDPVLRALPSLFVVRPPRGAARRWLSSSVEYAMAASAGGRPAASVDPRLPELLFSEVLRLYLADEEHAVVSGWLAALRDPVVGPALSLLHADPARAWTVRELAMAVAVSRTVLAEGFVRLLGRPPIRYLTEWRLRLATGLLSTGNATIAEVALAVGYSSEAAFSRAFKRAFGESPAHWRSRRHGAVAGSPRNTPRSPS
jgi:AraC-like DNA-binding protein